jgi:hypothetical protein
MVEIKENNPYKTLFKKTHCRFLNTMYKGIKLRKREK